ncbi:DNA glycosylase [Russula decolorans]
MKKMRRGNPRARAREVDLSHLPRQGALPEYLAEDLDVLFCGINPGRTSAIIGHHYANGTNHFWPCLHLSGFTPRQLLANEDSTLPEMYNLGLTNLVERASISEAQLLNREMANAVPALLARIARWRPRVICFNGKGIWVHVEHSLQQQLIHSYGSDDSVATGSRVAVPKREDEEELKPIIPDIGQERPVKTEQVTTACSSNLDAGRLLPASTSVPVPVGRGSAVSSPSSPVTPRRAAAAAQPTFVYGIQPYKSVHDVVPKNATVRETLFCVFPSSSGRVVTHQRNDKVVLYKKLREDLELIKAGTFDTSSMQLVRLVPQGV